MRRAVAAIVILVMVGGGGFGLGYLSGGQVTPRPRAAPSGTPRSILVPKVLHLPVTVALQRVMGVALTVAKVELRTGEKRGTIVAQFPPPGASAPAGSGVNLFVSTSLYPRGAFEQCPDVVGTLAVAPGTAQQAEQAAFRFSRAF